MEGLGMGDVAIFYGHLVYFTYGNMVYVVAIRYMIGSLGIFFPQFWYVAPRKVWQPWLEHGQSQRH
jgi:hypothetical protein